MAPTDMADTEWERLERNRQRLEIEAEERK
jgi:hypothetical protein